MNANEYFYKLLKIEPLYEAEPYFYKPFWDFQYRFQGLQRHWVLNRDYFSNHLNILRIIVPDGTAEFEGVVSETVGNDFNDIPEYVRLSTISYALSLLENLLGAVSEEIASSSGKEVILDKRPMPNLEKYILWLNRDCGLEIELGKKLRKNLTAIRDVRNKFSHRIDRDIPEHTKNIVYEMVDSSENGEFEISDQFVEISLKELAAVAKLIELAYIKVEKSSSSS